MLSEIGLWLQRIYEAAACNFVRRQFLFIVLHLYEFWSFNLLCDGVVRPGFLQNTLRCCGNWQRATESLNRPKRNKRSICSSASKGLPSLFRFELGVGWLPRFPSALVGNRQTGQAGRTAVCCSGRKQKEFASGFHVDGHTNARGRPHFSMTPPRVDPILDLYHIDPPSTYGIRIARRPKLRDARSPVL